MKREQLEELGYIVYIVRAELADEDIDDYLYVAEDQDGDLEVLHFYRNGLYLVPTVKGGDKNEREGLGINTKLRAAKSLQA